METSNPILRSHRRVQEGSLTPDPMDNPSVIPHPLRDQKDFYKMSDDRDSLILEGDRMALYKVRITTLRKRTGNIEIENQFVHAPNEQEAIEMAKFYDSFELPFMREDRQRTYDVLTPTPQEIETYNHNQRMEQ